MSADEPKRHGIANASLALALVSYLLVYGSGDPMGIPLGLFCAAMSLCLGLVSFVLAVLKPARYRVTAAAIIGCGGALLLLLSVVPALEIRQ